MYNNVKIYPSLLPLFSFLEILRENVYFVHPIGVITGVEAYTQKVTIVAKTYVPSIIHNTEWIKS